MWGFSVGFVGDGCGGSGSSVGGAVGMAEVIVVGKLFV